MRKKPLYPKYVRTLCAHAFTLPTRLLFYSFTILNVFDMPFIVATKI